VCFNRIAAKAPQWIQDNAEVKKICDKMYILAGALIHSDCIKGVVAGVVHTYGFNMAKVNLLCDFFEGKERLECQDYASIFFKENGQNITSEVF